MQDMWTWPHGLLPLALGAGMGFFGGLFGIGGGVIAIPLLVLGFGLDQAMAQGTALVMMVPNLLIGWWRYSRHQPVPWRHAVGIGTAASATTWAVAHLATGMASGTLRLVFCLGLAALACHMLAQQRAAGRPGARAADSQSRPALAARWLPAVGVLGGSSMGLLGIGGGLVATPVLTRWFGHRQTIAQSLALALVAPSSVIALGTYASAGRVHWPLGLPLAISGMLTVSAGVALAHRLPEHRMRQAFAWMLLATAIWLTAGTLQG